VSKVKTRNKFFILTQIIADVFAQNPVPISSKFDTNAN
jgi:hypothetical protein